MRLYTTCHCGHTIRLRGSYPTADEVRRQLGDFVTLHCPHCTVHSHPRLNNLKILHRFSI